MTPDSPANARLLDLRSYVQWFDAALPAEFCAKMVDSFHQMPQFQTANGRGHHSALDASAWVELNIQPHVDPAFMGFFYAQIDRYLGEYNKHLPMSLPVPTRPMLEDLRIKRYRIEAEDRFQPHFDAGDNYANRYMVFLWYLNDVAEGGETEFPDLGVKVQARAGRLLMFPPYWMFQHAGLKPRSNDKYIVSTYMTF
ncbi:MAG: 2OG-Fe(II) oxygenase [Proteobacteria bacterium]|uniref:2OG-Fe(II) oxygenase n=1 Tax=Rudaea sp. TaxID=2136325 RepID=UPI003784780D|nr:2OG-Fe(II) oxygenase [Pseudomonadota bacterium]